MGIEIESNLQREQETASDRNSSTIEPAPTTMQPRIACELESHLRTRLIRQLVRRLQSEIGMHLMSELDLATVKSLLDYDPALIPTMQVELEIHSHPHNDSQFEMIRTLLTNELQLPLRFSAEIIIDLPLQCVLNINNIQTLLARAFESQIHMQLGSRPSYLSHRDRDIWVDLPLVGGSVPDLA